MSRSFHNGTPNWAKVATRPVVRRFNSREAILNELEEMHEAAFQEEREAAVESLENDLRLTDMYHLDDAEEKTSDPGDYEDEGSYYDL